MLMHRKLRVFVNNSCLKVQGTSDLQLHYQEIVEFQTNISQRIY